MSLARYKLLDLTVFAAIVCVLEVVSQKALVIAPKEIFSFSTVMAVTLIVFVRWGGWGLIHAVLGGAVFALAHGGEGETVLLYCVGNLGLALALLAARYIPGERLRTSALCLTLYTAAGFGGMCLGRALMGFLLERQLTFGEYLLRYISADALNGVITLVVLSIAARQNGILEDQLSYLRRIHKEEENKNASQNPK